MSFLSILRECNLDFNRAKDIYYGFTDLQIAWLNKVTEKEANERDREANKTNKFGEQTRSFNMKQE